MSDLYEFKTHFNGIKTVSFCFYAKLFRRQEEQLKWLNVLFIYDHCIDNLWYKTYLKQLLIEIGAIA